jgi:hypothetical protein
MNSLIFLMPTHDSHSLTLQSSVRLRLVLGGADGQAGWCRQAECKVPMARENDLTAIDPIMPIIDRVESADESNTTCSESRRHIQTIRQVLTLKQIYTSSWLHPRFLDLINGDRWGTGGVNREWQGRPRVELIARRNSGRRMAPEDGAGEQGMME